MISIDYTKQQQYAILSILILIMEADGIVDPNEVKFLNRMLTVFHISESELEIISAYDINLCRNILREMSQYEIAQAKSLFMEMAKCDGYADPRELEIISQLGD